MDITGLFRNTNTITEENLEKFVKSIDEQNVDIIIVLEALKLVPFQRSEQLLSNLKKYNSIFYEDSPDVLVLINKTHQEYNYKVLTHTNVATTFEFYDYTITGFYVNKLKRDNPIAIIPEFRKITPKRLLIGDINLHCWYDDQYIEQHQATVNWTWGLRDELKTLTRKHKLRQQNESSNKFQNNIDVIFSNVDVNVEKLEHEDPRVIYRWQLEGAHNAYQFTIG